MSRMTDDDCLLCYAHGGAAGWEALCVDLDLSVQASTLPEAQTLLTEAVRDYISCAMAEAPATRDRLLARRAPLWTKLALTARLVAFNVFRGPRREAQASFPVPCHA